MSLTIQPVAGALGAEVSNIDLREPLDRQSFAEVRQALVRHQVLFFRDQPIEAAQQKALADWFGPLQTHPAYATLPGFPEITILESTLERPTKIEKWHSDMTFRAHPPQATMLRSRIVPEVGGDTLFASMTAAYRGLSAPMQALLRESTAVHDFAHGFRESLAEAGGRERLEQALKDNPPVEHPVIRTHPESGEKLLFVNELFTTRVCGLSPKESDYLLTFLFEHLAAPEYCCRFRWSVDALTIWDNRSVQHKPVNDYFPAHRRMERIAIDGDRPY